MTNNASDYTQDGFSLTLGRSPIHESETHDGLVHLWWRSDFLDERLVQVYVNGELIEVTHNSDQREVWLILDRAVDNRVELLAVRRDRPELLWQPRPDLLKSWDPPINQMVRAKVLRDEALPIETKVAVAINGIEVEESPLWSGDTPRSGFGGLFGLGGFGRDDATGLGLGRGALGLGPLGADATPWCWNSSELDPGTHTVTLTARDARGVDMTPPQTLRPMDVDALPQGASSLTVDPDFTLTWSQ
ncbi:MAG: hypothetical protein AAGH99_08490 [Planctomycetota bacterium]